MKRSVVLDVRDGRTKAPLRGVTVDAAHVLWKRGGWGHPREPHERVGAGDSPLTLERRVTPNEYLPIVVEAPGYAPALVEIFEPLLQAENIVELLPPGTLELEITDVSADAPTELRVFWLETDLRRRANRLARQRANAPESTKRQSDADSLDRGPDPTLHFDLDYVRKLRTLTPFQTWPICGPGRFRIHGLPAGASALLLRTSFDGVAFDIGMAAFKVEPELASRVTVHGRSSVGLPGIRVAGTITVDPAWQVSRHGTPLTARLECQEIDATSGAIDKLPHRDTTLAVDDEGVRLAFDFGAVWPGSYVVRVPEFEASHAILVGSENVDPVAHDFAIAPPADVDLTLRLEGASMPFDRARVLWRPSDSPREEVPFFVAAEQGLAPDPDSGRFHFRAPAGRIRVVAAPPSETLSESFVVPFHAVEREFDLIPGRNELSIALSRHVEAVLVLRDGMRNVPYSETSRIDVEADGKPVETWITRTKEGNASLTLPGSGRYRIAVAGIEGYEASKVEVELHRRTRELVLIPLRRSSIA